MARSRWWVTGTSLRALCGTPATAGGSSGSSGSLPMQWMTSARTPSTPRSSQKRSTSCMASTTAGWSQSRSGWADSNRCRYHWPDAGSRVQAGAVRSNEATQLLGGAPSGVASRQTYQSRWALSRPDTASTNHGCWSEVWLGTQSMMIRSPRAWASSTRWSNSSRVPNRGSTSQ